MIRNEKFDYPEFFLKPHNFGTTIPKLAIHSDEPFERRLIYLLEIWKRQTILCRLLNTLNTF